MFSEVGENDILLSIDYDTNSCWSLGVLTDERNKAAKKKYQYYCGQFAYATLERNQISLHVMINYRLVYIELAFC